MYFHYQNLKKENYENKLVHGRCWLGENQFHAEWSIPSRFYHARVSLNDYGETTIGLHLSVGLFSLYLAINNRKLFKLLAPITRRNGQKYTNGRVIGVSYHNKTLWFSLWEDPMEWRGTDPKWWKFNLDFAKLLFGKRKCITEILQEGKAKIDMPEGVYDATYKVEHRIWRRPRWPFAVTRTSIYFDIPVGLPHEGKGENSWDMGMDATFGTGTEWKGNVHAATKIIALETLKERQRHGSLNSSDYSKWRKERFKRLTLKKKGGNYE